MPVQIASVQTLARRRPIDAVGLLVVDEAHHATAETYLRIIESHPDAIVLGLTATPWRLTGKKLGSLFDGIVAVANYPFLIEQGYLVRPRVFLPGDAADFDLHATSPINARKAIPGVPDCMRDVPTRKPW